MSGNNTYDGFAWRDYNELSRLNDVERLAVLKGLDKSASLDDIHKKDIDLERQARARNAGLDSAASWQELSTVEARRGQAEAHKTLERINNWTESVRAKSMGTRQK